MASNRDIIKQFNLYAELLQLHEKDEQLSHLLSGAAYRLRQIDEPVTAMGKSELSSLFKPKIISVIEELKQKHSIEALDELIQLTPSGLFDMMRIKGLGGKKLAVLWKSGED